MVGAGSREVIIRFVCGVQDEAIACAPTDRPMRWMGSPTGRSRARVKDELFTPSYLSNSAHEDLPPGCERRDLTPSTFYPPGCERRDLPLLPFYPPFENGEKGEYPGSYIRLNMVRLSSL